MWSHKPIQGTPIISGHLLAPDVGFFLFNEGMGDLVNDLSENENNGTWSGTGIHWGPGKDGPAGIFNGTDDWVVLGSSITIDENSTISLRFKWDGGVTDILCGDTTSNNLIYLVNSQLLRLKDNSGNNRNFAVPTIGTLTWYNLVITKDSASNWRLFLNNIESSTGAINGAEPFIITRIGHGYSNSGYSWGGLIDEVYIYNRDLSAEDLTELYSNPHVMFAVEDLAWLYAEVAPPVGHPYYYQQLINRRYAA